MKQSATMAIAIPIQLLVALVGIAAAVPLSSSASAPASAELSIGRSEAQRVIDAIPVAERAYFVTFHLAREAQQQGRNDVNVMPDLPVEKLQAFKDVEVPRDFGRNLLVWVEEEILADRMITKHEHVSSKVWSNESRFEVCFPQGCVDPNEIGTNCCPF